jgi:hypothetical protein
METKNGGCHCGKVRYAVEIDLGQPALECNCSHCQIKGMLWQFVPADAFTLTQGEDALAEYRFNTNKIQHLFCGACGVESFSRGFMPDGSPCAAINVRAIDGIDLASINRQPVDGRNLF